MNSMCRLVLDILIVGGIGMRETILVWKWSMGSRVYIKGVWLGVWRPRLRLEG